MRSVSLPLAIFLCLLCNSIVYGQGEFGIKAGVNMSKVAGDFEYYKTTHQTGIQVGLVYRYPLSEKVFIRPEISFVQKGGKIDNTIKYYDEAMWELTGVQRINYLEIPINLDIRLNSKTDNYFIIGFGLYGAVAVGGQLDLRNDFTDYYQPSESRVIHYNMPMEFKDVVTAKDQSDLGTFEEEYGFMKKYDVGIKLGFGYCFKSFLIDLSYGLGFSDINPHEEGVTSNEIAKSNNSLQFSLTHFIKK